MINNAILRISNPWAMAPNIHDILTHKDKPMSNPLENAVTRTTPPFRADHVGSFLRPEAVKLARQQAQEGTITLEALRAVEDTAIAALVEQQKACGLHVVTDGELRRSWWHYDFFAGLDGIEKVATEKALAFHGVQPKAEKVILTGKVDFGNHPMLADFAFLHSVAGNAVAKMCIPSPAILHMVLAVRDEQFTLPACYANDDAFCQGLVEAYQKAVLAFYAAGCRYLQLDDTSWGSLCSPEERAKMEKRGINPDAIAKRYVAMLNEVIAVRPKDMTITMHICRGNFRSTWLTSGGYEPVAEELFGNAKLDGFFLEYDTERAGNFAPLRHIQNQQVVLGLVSSKVGTLENKEEVKKRIAEAAQYVPINQLCLSPQCGFSSTEEGNIITQEEQWDKIRLVVQTAAQVWK